MSQQVDYVLGFSGHVWRGVLPWENRAHLSFKGGLGELSDHGVFSTLRGPWVVLFVDGMIQALEGHRVDICGCIISLHERYEDILYTNTPE